MRTYPITRTDGHVFAFEINTPLILKPLLDLLKSIPGVSDVERARHSDDRITFKYQGKPFIVHEPWGDSSRYWIGPADAESDKVDIGPLHQSFQQHQHQGWIRRLFSKFSAKHEQPAKERFWTYLWKLLIYIEVGFAAYPTTDTAYIFIYRIFNNGNYPFKTCIYIDVYFTGLQLLVLLGILAMTIYMLEHVRWLRYPFLLYTALVGWETGDLVWMGLTDPPFLFSTPWMIGFFLCLLTTSVMSFTVMRKRFIRIPKLSTG